MVLIGLQVCKWVKLYIFMISYKLTSHDPWPLFVTFDFMNIWRFLHYINNPSLVPIGLQLFKWGEFYILSPILQLDLWWPLTARTYKGFHNVLINQVWFQSDFNFSNESTFTFSAYLTTWPQITFDQDVTFHLINKWGFPCCIYDPTLVEINQSMWKVEPNVNLFSQQTTTTDNNMGQSDSYVSFLLREWGGGEEKMNAKLCKAGMGIKSWSSHMQM